MCHRKHYWGFNKKKVQKAPFGDAARRGYKPLFKNEQEVIDSIVSRYADEELAITPITDTSSRIKEIKKEIIEMYEGIAK